MDDAHWRVTGANHFAVFFRAIHLIPGAAFVALAGGAGSADVRASLSKLAVEGVSREGLTPEFRQAVCVPVGDAQMRGLATLAGRCAEPEIAAHVAAFSAEARLVEWFDAPADPIAISSRVEAEAVSRFASELGANSEWVAGGV
jgi:hypothetical protein